MLGLGLGLGWSSHYHSLFARAFTLTLTLFLALFLALTLTLVLTLVLALTLACAGVRTVPPGVAGASHCRLGHAPYEYLDAGASHSCRGQGDLSISVRVSTTGKNKRKSNDSQDKS